MLTASHEINLKKNHHNPKITLQTGILKNSFWACLGALYEINIYYKTLHTFSISNKTTSKTTHLNSEIFKKEYEYMCGVSIYFHTSLWLHVDKRCNLRWVRPYQNEYGSCFYVIFCKSVILENIGNEIGYVIYTED